MKKLLLTLCLLQISIFAAMAQTELLPQRNFPDAVPAGNYSGIAPLGGGRYAVVSDKSATDGFFVFHIDVDSVSGQIRDVRNEGFRPATLSNRDEEGIAFRSADSTVYISGEVDNAILQYRLDGTPTGRRFTLPADLLAACRGNLSLESLSYNVATHRFWTCNEGAPVVIASFGDDMLPRATYHYEMDAPVHDASRAQYYAHGVSELLALDDGTLLVLEREFYVPHEKIGASVTCRIYRVNPIDTTAAEPQQTSVTQSPTDQASAEAKQTSVAQSPTDQASAEAKQTSVAQPSTHLSKTLVCEWETSLSLFGRSLANYEGMCLGPRLADGRQVVILVADSQNQYAGVLKDWFRVLLMRP
jgi:uncharacterized protein YjiK